MLLLALNAVRQAQLVQLPLLNLWGWGGANERLLKVGAIESACCYTASPMLPLLHLQESATPARRLLVACSSACYPTTWLRHRLLLHPPAAALPAAAPACCGTACCGTRPSLQPTFSACCHHSDFKHNRSTPAATHLLHILVVVSSVILQLGVLEHNNLL